MLDTWSLDFTIDAQGLRDIDPLPLILPFIQQTTWLRHQHTIAHNIIAELYTNALEHGILQLDSNMKNTPLGFANYQKQKQQRLQELTAGQMRLQLAANPHSGGGDEAIGGRLHVVVIDSGSGFNFQEELQQNLKQTGYAGRGLLLLKMLCTELVYHEPGNHVEAILEI